MKQKASSTQTKVDTKVSKKTKIVLSLVMLSAAAGIFAMFGMGTISIDNFQKTRLKTSLQADNKNVVVNSSKMSFEEQYRVLHNTINEIKLQKSGSLKLNQALTNMQNLVVSISQFNSGEKSIKNLYKPILTTCQERYINKSYPENKDFFACLEKEGVPVKELFGYTSEEILSSINEIESGNATIYGSGSGDGGCGNCGGCGYCKKCGKDKKDCCHCWSFWDWIIALILGID